MTQGELEQIPQAVGRAFTKLEQRIMEDVVRKIRVNGFSSSSTDWQLYRLQQLGKSEEDIRKWIQEALAVSNQELDGIFSDQVYRQYTGQERAFRLYGMRQIPFTQNTELQRIIEGVRQNTSGTFQRITGSLGFVKENASGRLYSVSLTEFYQSTLDEAMYAIHSGAFSYQTVLNRVIHTMTRSGIRWIDYDSHHHSRIDAAARRAVMTGFRQVQGKINEQTARQLGTDSYEVTWHMGARPTHQPWQGRVWTMQQLQEVCGLGSVTGLHGANCYHDYNAFIPGISVRAYTNEWLDEQNRRENTPKNYLGRDYTTYEALQKQRQMEAAIRKYRRDIRLMDEGGSSDRDIMLRTGHYRGKMQEYKKFSKAMGLPTQEERLYQDGLGRVEQNVFSGIMKRTGGSMKMNLQFFSEKDIQNQESGSLKRAIRKYSTRIEEHRMKISRPKDFYPEWDYYDDRYKEGLKRHWNKEINNFERSIQDRISELKRRGDYDG